MFEAPGPKPGHDPSGHRARLRQRVIAGNDEALGDVTGVDIWNINADESVAFEYSRFNYNATNFYQANQFRASDHDPEIIGIDIPGYPRSR